MSRKKYGDEIFKKDLGKIYDQDPIFATGYNMLLQASAIRNGVDPNLVLDYAKFKATRDPGFWEGVQNFFKKEGEPLAGGRKLPTYGLTQPLTQEKQTQQEQQSDIEKRQAGATQTLQEWGIE